MKSRNEAEQVHADGSRDDIRELAESLSLFGSAMRHAAARQPQKAWIAPKAPARVMRTRLLLAPALAAMLAAAALVPLFVHRHNGTPAAHVAINAQQPNTEPRAGVNDTVLMNQIDSDVSEEVPDALAPLADLSEQAAVATTSHSEQKNGTQN